jgi:Protein of unknown function (DUF2846)
MKRQSLTIVVVFLIAAFAQVAPGQRNAATVPLANNDVVSMAKAGLSADVIIAKVETSECAFDTSPAALEKLKAAGVPESVILAMVKAPDAGASVGEPAHSVPLVHQQMASPQASKPGMPLTQTPLLGGRDAAQNTKAVVHFYRERAFQASLRKIPINIDGVKIANLVNGRQFTIRLDPGKHIIRSKTKLKAISVNMKPGNVYYFRAEFSQGFMKNQWLIVQVASEQGAADIQRLKPLDVKDVVPFDRTAETK